MVLEWYFYGCLHILVSKEKKPQIKKHLIVNLSKSEIKSIIKKRLKERWKNNGIGRKKVDGFTEFKGKWGRWEVQIKQERWNSNRMRFG